MVHGACLESKCAQALVGSNPTSSAKCTINLYMEQFKNDTVDKLKIPDFETDDQGYVNFGDVSLGVFQQQSQYVTRYVDGLLEGYPKLGEGLRIEGKSDNPYTMKIYKDDIPEFVKRYKKYRHLD